MAIDSFPTSIGGLLDILAGLGAGANWQERLKGLNIITPDGKNYNPRFIDLQTSKTNKTSAYQFSEQKGDYVQNFGRGATDFSTIMIFEGDNYDKSATKFEASLGEKGNCELNHPRYGTFDVVVTGWKRSDNETSGAGQAQIEVSILETIILEVPNAKGINANGLFAQIAAFINAAIDAYNTFESIADTIANDINTITAIVDGLSVAVSTIISEVSSIDDKFNTLKNSILNNITDLVTTPDALASSLAELFLLPSAAIASDDSTKTVDDLISAYDTAYERIISVAPEASNDKNFINQSLTTQLTSGLTIAAQAQSFVNGSYLTVTDSTDALNSILDKYNTNQAFNDAQQAAGAGNDLTNYFTVSDTQACTLRQAVSYSASILLQLAFDAKREIIKVLDSTTNFIPLCKELYGDVSNDNLSFLIETNELTGSELIELPRGKEIKYYA